MDMSTGVVETIPRAATPLRVKRSLDDLNLDDPTPSASTTKIPKTSETSPSKPFGSRSLKSTKSNSRGHRRILFFSKLQAQKRAV